MYDCVYLYMTHQKSRLSQTITIHKQKCQRCGKAKLITDTQSGEIFCGGCGFVFSERIEDSGPEHRNFMDSREDSRRAGAGTTLSRHDMGLATIINPKNIDSTGKTLSPYMKSTLNRLRLWDSRSQAHKSSERNFRLAFNYLGRLKDKLAISDATVEKTAYIYRKAIEKGIVRGRSIQSLLAASLYAACRDAETPRTLRDIEEASNIKRKEIFKCYQVLVEKLDLKIPLVDSVQCLSRIGNELKLSEKTKRYGMKVLSDFQKTGKAAGKSPTGLAATTLYLACVKMGEHRTQKQVSKAANITEVTIRNRLADIRNTLNLTDSNRKQNSEEIKQ